MKKSGNKINKIMTIAAITRCENAKRTAFISFLHTHDDSQNIPILITELQSATNKYKCRQQLNLAWAAFYSSPNTSLTWKMSLWFVVCCFGADSYPCVNRLCHGTACLDIDSVVAVCHRFTLTHPGLHLVRTEWGIVDEKLGVYPQTPKHSSGTES